MTGAELLVRCLENEGLEHMFGVPGEENIAVLDAILDSKIRFLQTRHEQGAAFMADVQGRLTGKASVCLATLGPGATNLLTGVADANMDRAPLVAITGQVSTERFHKESHQYLDLISLYRPAVKWNAQLIRPQVMPEAVRKAFKVAQTEKPGATHLDLPEDVADAAAPADLAPLVAQQPFPTEPSERQIERAAKIISDAREPYRACRQRRGARPRQRGSARFRRHARHPGRGNLHGKRQSSRYPSFVFRHRRTAGA